jgi:lysophospholipase L1-like esterase
LADTDAADSLKSVLIPLAGTSHPDSENFNARVKEMNSRLMALATSRGLVYIDLDMGISNIDQFRIFDGIHFNSRGYKQWESRIKPLLC